MSIEKHQIFKLSIKHKLMNNLYYTDYKYNSELRIKKYLLNNLS